MENQSKEIRPFTIYGVFRKQFEKVVPPFVCAFDDKSAIEYFSKEFDYIYDDIQKQVDKKEILDIDSARAGFIDSVRDTCVIKLAIWDIEKQEFINDKNILCDFKDWKKEVKEVNGEACIQDCVE